MTLFSAFSGLTPPSAGSRSTDWETLVKRRIRVEPRLMWRSAPIRLQRLILDATRQDPNERSSVSEIEAELQLLVEAVSGRTSKLPIEYWAEELMSRCEEADYHFIRGKSEYRREPREGRSISLTGNPASRSIKLAFRNRALDSTDWSKIDRLWKEKLNRAKEILRKGGWEQIDNSRYAGMEILLGAEISLELVENQFSSVLEVLKRALVHVRIE